MTLRVSTLVLLLQALIATGMCAGVLPSKPRLVVVVSFDQFRGDMPESFARFLGGRGFNRIAKEGATYTRCMFDHANNITGPGHAALLTGCYPHKTGIVGNDFCLGSGGPCMYCAQDTSGVFSAAHLRVPTLGDVLRAASPASKVVGVALKDRAAILMAGGSATTCVWFDAGTAAWTSSAAYPRVQWLAALNKAVNVRKYAGRLWTTRIPQSMDPAPDTVAGEGNFPGGTSVFPHRIPPNSTASVLPGQVSAVLCSPFATSMVFDAAIAALRRERLGADAFTDVLCVGVSSTDYVGHLFGPDSREVQEMYTQADEELGRFIDVLDKTVGRSKYVLVVTSDHGVAPIPEVMQRRAQAQRAVVDAGRIAKDREIAAPLDSVLRQRFGPPEEGPSYVRVMKEPSVYLQAPADKLVSRNTVAEAAADFLRTIPGVGFVAARDNVINGKCPPNADALECLRVRRSIDAERTGDVVLYPKRYWIFGRNPATHGTAHDYDRHVPLMFFGGSVRPQRSSKDVAPVDIAPTLGKILGVELPNIDGQDLQCIGE